MSIQTNNNYLVLYLSWITKTIVALHKLINNKIMLKEEEKLPDKKDSKKEGNDLELVNLKNMIELGLKNNQNIYDKNQI